jgi:endoglucanase
VSRSVLVTAVSAALASAAIGAWLVARVGGGSEAEPASAGDEAALAAAEQFLETYQADDGRVIRHDQGGDTVSEGQAYAMLLAAAIGDPARFDRAWSWASANLRRPDGLFASRWQDGAVLDQTPATDADLDIARALLVGAGRFDEPRYRRQGLSVGAAILEHEVAEVAGRDVLVAGPWAAGAGTVNPSYFDPRSFAALGAASRDPRWNRLAVTSREIIAALTANPPGLPPDWARVGEGPAQPIADPGDPASGPRYGYEAVRVPVRFAASCEAAERELAARSWPFLSGAAEGEIAAEYGLDGQPLGAGSHPAAIVGAAAAAGAGGDPGTRDELLARAAEAEAAGPSYYGAAWVALGRVMLTTDWLGGC